MSSTELHWCKSSYSGGGGDNCVEVATDPAHAIHVRDSKQPEGRRLTLSPTAWSAFVGYAALDAHS